MLYFVYLRRPREVNDLRSDPFWEFGSFGSTGCHRNNLLHPTRDHLLDGDQLVFLQGGDQEIRVVGLTPPITVHRGAALLNLRWDINYRPIPYDKAPVFIDNQSGTNFPAVMNLLAGTQRSTYCGKAASRLRSRTHPVEIELASQLHALFDQPDLPKIKHYLEAVEGKNSDWIRHGLQAGWADLTRREERYAELTGVRPTPSTCEIAQTSQVRRSRC